MEMLKTQRLTLRDENFASRGPLTLQQYLTLADSQRVTTLSSLWGVDYDFEGKPEQETRIGSTALRTKVAELAEKYHLQDLKVAEGLASKRHSTQAPTKHMMITFSNLISDKRHLKDMATQINNMVLKSTSPSLTFDLYSSRTPYFHVSILDAPRWDLVKVAWQKCHSEVLREIRRVLRG